MIHLNFISYWIKLFFSENNDGNQDLCENSSSDDSIDWPSIEPSVEKIERINHTVLIQKKSGRIDLLQCRECHMASNGMSSAEGHFKRHHFYPSILPVMEILKTMEDKFYPYCSDNLSKEIRNQNLEVLNKIEMEYSLSFKMWAPTCFNRLQRLKLFLS